MGANNQPPSQNKFVLNCVKLMKKISCDYYFTRKKQNDLILYRRDTLLYLDLLAPPLATEQLYVPARARVQLRGVSLHHPQTLLKASLILFIATLDTATLPPVTIYFLTPITTLPIATFLIATLPILLRADHIRNKRSLWVS